MSTSEICHPTVPGPCQDEELENKIMASYMLNENPPIIHKVPHPLRQVNEKAYEPNVISIGPYHYGKPHLKEMEDIKRRFFSEEESKENLRAALGIEEEILRKCYVETSELSSEEFVNMVVCDGFFIVQLFRDIVPPDLLQRRYFLNGIVYDLLLLENQLPFFVLEEIYKIITPNNKEKFTDLALLFFEKQIGKTKSSEENIKHLLGLIHDTPRWRPSNGTKQEDEDKSKKPRCGWKFIPCGREQEKTEKEDKRRNFIRCARELEEAGISFEKRDEKKEKCRALDIVFKGNCRKAKLRIPKLEVDDHTEQMLRNLIAFEQFFPNEKPTYVFDYVRFLDQLINTEKDVQLLSYSGIIENRLGDDQAVAQVFNRLRDNTYKSSEFHYAGVFEQVNRHWDKPWNKHMATLQRKYFNSPWAHLSFLAALILLSFTIAQTIFTLLTVGCHSCMVVLIVFSVIIVVIALFFRLCLG